MRRFWIAPAALAIGLLLGSLAEAGTKNPQGIPILSTEALAMPGGRPAPSTATLSGVVWAHDRLRIWFEPQGRQLTVRVVDDQGLVRTEDHLSQAAEKALGGQEDDPEAQRRAGASNRVAVAYNRLPSGPVDVLELRRGALLQSHSGKFVVLYYAEVDGQGLLHISSTPNPSTIGRYFPERPNLWTRLTRWVASLLPWVDPPLLSYRRAPSDWVEPYQAGDPDWTWPFDVVLTQGGVRGWKFFNRFAADAWRLDKGDVLRPTALAVPRGPSDAAAVERLRASIPADLAADAPVSEAAPMAEGAE